jgi:MoaA/NifB/PqqE/SkfB family radical SAM enzyme
MMKYGKFIDIIAVSVDSFHRPVNGVKRIRIISSFQCFYTRFLLRLSEALGRSEGSGSKDHLKGVYRASELCQEHKVIFKINTVVNSLNVDENMCEQILKLNPKRWKVFQVSQNYQHYISYCV